VSHDARTHTQPRTGTHSHDSMPCEH
jgi:hypothetical protein